MAFDVKFTNDSLSQLAKLDIYSKAIVLAWIKKNLQDCYNPRLFGYQIEKYNYNAWKYPVGIHSLLATIDNESIIIKRITNC